MDHRSQEKVIGNETRKVSQSPDNAARRFLLEADRYGIEERVDRKGKEHRQSRRDEERGQQPLASIWRAEESSRFRHSPDSVLPRATDRRCWPWKEKCQKRFRSRSSAACAGAAASFRVNAT